MKKYFAVALILLASVLGFTPAGRAAVSHLIPVSVQQFAAGTVSVDAPVELTTDGPTQGTTVNGQPYTSTMYSGSMPNSDFYGVDVSTYGFTVEYADLDKATEGFRNAVNGTILHQEHLTVSGQPALASMVFSTKTGKEIRLAVLITFKGNSLYQFVFVTAMDAPNTDQEAVNTFFNSAKLN
jgi:hypothetical protein